MEEVDIVPDHHKSNESLGKCIYTADQKVVVTFVIVAGFPFQV